MRLALSRTKLEELFSRGLAWAFAGALFAFIYVAVTELLRAGFSYPWYVIAASIGTGGLTALIYSSMRLSVVVAISTFIATVVYLWIGGATPAMQSLIWIGGGVGMVLGAIYGWSDSRSRVYCADAKLVAGVSSGLLAALLLAVPLVLAGPDRLPWLAMMLAPLAILIYVSSAAWFIRRCQNLVPAVIDGALVGLAIGAVTGLLFMVLAATLEVETGLTGVEMPFAHRVHEWWIGVIAGSAGLCFLVGVARGILGVKWYDL